MTPEKRAYYFIEDMIGPSSERPEALKFLTESFRIVVREAEERVRRETIEIVERVVGRTLAGERAIEEILALSSQPKGTD